ncbi:tyrosine-type recombinase/integrase [Salimicrobium jeotgali]|uniref:tyrosine-type recombinase/integrase n=1 Tax=Salimicrobium jeotgali TaxID=1230341 RepID=UPI000C84FE20|nr:tyrosine-type recombinase/integrase [Salimicrobium jeotgali]
MGYIEKRGKNSFRLNVVTGYNDKGKAVMERISVKAKNATEAKRKLVSFEAEVLAGDYTKPDHTRLSDFYHQWLQLHANRNLSERTKNEYVGIIHDKILPRFGHMKMTDIKPIHCVTFITELQEPQTRQNGREDTLSASTIRNNFKALNSLLKTAKELGVIKDNPAENVKLPKVQRKSKTNYNTEVVETLVKAIELESYEKQVMFWVTFVCGCREGELVGLEEKHILEEECAIRFEQSVSQLKGGTFQIKEIKNGVEGVVAIPKGLMDMIKKLKHEKKRAYLQIRDAWWDPQRVFLFSNETGKPYRPDSISQWWARFRKKNNIEGVRFHDLRHFSVTYLIQQNVQPKVISSRVRHKKIGTTMDIYGHHIQESDTVAAEHFDVFFGKENTYK